MKTTICFNKLDIIITKIDIINQRYLKAHESIGFEKRKDYKFEDKNRSIVSLKV
jgi:RimJ/RimL family protein N-acetyltransferase